MAQRNRSFQRAIGRRRGCCSSGAGVTDDQFCNLLFSMATFVILFITGWIMTKIWRRRLKRDEVPKDVGRIEDQRRRPTQNRAGNSPRFYGSGERAEERRERRLSPLTHRWHTDAVGSSTQMRGVSWCCMYRATTKSASRAARITQMLKSQGGKSEQARVAAANAILDCAYGKPVVVEKNHYHQCEPLTGRGGSGLQIGRFVRSLDPKEREKNDHAHMSKPNR
jgi:hypothetical protein